MTALNKMMYCYLEAEEAGRDYIDKAEVKRIRGWRGPSTYSQYERSITNFGLSDTSWSDNDRSALPLSDKGKKLFKTYALGVSLFALTFGTSMTVFAADDPMSVVNNLSNFTIQTH